ncbi:MAG: hypothetical protein AAF823_14760 [Planctomycetota bacterium]
MRRTPNLFAAVLAAGCCLATVSAAHGQEGDPLNVLTFDADNPVNVTPPAGANFVLSDNTQVNINEGGTLTGGPDGSFFVQLGPNTPNDGPEINLQGGTLGPGIETRRGTLNVFDGVIDKSFESASGFRVNVHGGTFESGVDEDGNEQSVTFGGFTTFHGGAIPRTLKLGARAKVELVGSRFRLDGKKIDSFDGRLGFDQVLTAVLEDGTPIYLTRQTSEILASRWTFTFVKPNKKDRRSLTLRSDDSPLSGVSPNQNVELRGQAEITDDAVILSAKLNMRNGVVGDDVTAIDSTVTVRNGNIGTGFTALDGSRISVRGGEVAEVTLGENTRLSITGGVVETLNLTNGLASLNRGRLGDNVLVEQGSLRIRRGSVGTFIEESDDPNADPPARGTLRSTRGTMVINGGTFNSNVFLGGSGSTITAGTFRGDVETGSRKNISGGNFFGEFKPGELTRVLGGTFRGTVTPDHAVDIFRGDFRSNVVIGYDPEDPTVDDDSGRRFVELFNGRYRDKVHITDNGDGGIYGGNFTSLTVDGNGTLAVRREPFRGTTGGTFTQKVTIDGTANVLIDGGLFQEGIDIGLADPIIIPAPDPEEGEDPDPDAQDTIVPPSPRVTINSGRFGPGLNVAGTSTVNINGGKFGKTMNVTEQSNVSVSGGSFRSGFNIIGDAPTGDETGIDVGEFAKFSIVSGDVGNINMSGKSIVQYQRGKANIKTIGEGSILQLVGTSFSLDGRDLTDDILSINDFSLESLDEIDDLSTFTGTLTARLLDGRRIRLKLGNIDIDPGATIALYLPASRSANSIGLDTRDSPFVVPNEDAALQLSSAPVLIPEPSTAALALTAAGIALLRRRTA